MPAVPANSQITMPADGQIEEMHPPLSRSEAAIEASRCYFCHDAPCITACPTGIDIPLFIQQIHTGNINGSAKTIFSQNIMGGICARVCPTEVLCEQACVRNTHEDQPVRIGLLQRHATDPSIESDKQYFERAEASGKRVAVVGAGPAGLSCAHRLAMLGHDVVVIEQREKSGGLNEYGIAAYKAMNGIAQAEVGYILAIGGIDVQHGTRLGRDVSLRDLREDYDAVFLAIGLSGVNDLGLVEDEDDIDGLLNAVDYIEDLRQASDLYELPTGQNVVVIGGGMTAIDVAVQSKMLGAPNVTIAYRRGPDDMPASEYERNFAQTKGVTIKYWHSPKNVLAGNGRVVGMEFEYTGPDLNEDQANGAPRERLPTSFSRQ